MDPASRKDLTIMFYNVENFFDYTDDPKIQDEEFLPTSEKKWDKKKYEDKLKKIAQVIDASVKGIALPDIIGFCEIENNHVLIDLVQKSKLNTRPYTSLCSTGQDSRGINVGLMYDKSLFDFVSYKELNAIWPELPDNKTRNILCVTLKYKITGEELYILVNHWPSRRDGQVETEPRRIHAAKIVRKQVDEILEKNRDAKIIVMGDLNDTPKDKSVFHILKANAKPEKEKGELLNPYLNFENRGEGTHVEKGEWSVFDNIILSTGFLENTGLKFNPENTFILKNDFVLFKNYKTQLVRPNPTFRGRKYFNGYSNHLAVYIILNT